MSTEAFARLILAVIGAGTILNAVREFIADRFCFDLRHFGRRRWDRPGAWVADGDGQRGRVLELVDYGYGSIGTVAVVAFVDEHGYDLDPVLAPVRYLLPATKPVIEAEPARAAA